LSSGCDILVLPSETTPGRAEGIPNPRAALVPYPHPPARSVGSEAKERGVTGSADRSAEVYGAVGGLIGSAERNVALVENATVAFSQALTAVAPGPGDVVVTTRNDYVSNQLMYLSLAERRGVEVARAADLPGGGVDPESVRELVALRRLIAHLGVAPGAEAMCKLGTNLEYWDTFGLGKGLDIRIDADVPDARYLAFFHHAYHSIAATASYHNHHNGGRRLRELNRAQGLVHRHMFSP
jgi:hypothetical protein